MCATRRWVEEIEDLKIWNILGPGGSEPPTKYVFLGAPSPIDHQNDVSNDRLIDSDNIGSSDNTHHIPTD